MKNFTFILLCFLSLNVLSQNDTTVNRGIYEVKYSQKFKQPLLLTYSVDTNRCTSTRKGLGFYTEPGIITSTNDDYYGNEYDKGHLASAASFCQTKKSMETTFSYLNCALQHKNLNRGLWKSLEMQERKLALTDSVIVKVEMVFSKSSKVLKSGAVVPDAFIKTITLYHSKKTYVYKFPNTLITDKILEHYKIN